MKISFRALLAVALLAGFPVLILLITAGFAAGEWYALEHAPLIAPRLAFLGVPAVGVLLWTFLAIERTPEDDRPGTLPVPPEAQPRLWALVRELAAEVGTRPPDEIHLIAEANASVADETRWLGLQLKRRRMSIGAQLLAGLRQDQLRSVLGHELAHYGNGDTRFSALTYRGQRSMLRVMDRLRHASGFVGFFRPLLRSYAKLYFVVAMRVCRDRELAADQAAARVAGTAAATSALREVEALEVTWQFFVREYVALGWSAGYLPARLAEGYRRLLADEGRAAEIDELRRNPREGAASRYDSHPPTTERIAALESSPEVPARPGGEQPASELLRDPLETLDTALVTNLTAEAGLKQRTGWAELVDLGSRYRATEAALEVLGGLTLERALDALDAGRNEPLALPGFAVPRGTGPRARREMVADSVRRRMSVVITAALAEAGAARWTLSWSGPPVLTVDAPWADAFPPALDRACAVEADTGPLRALLAEAGVPPGYRPIRSAAVSH
ncbi:M48 family metalloprotease [Amycolatopsis saalfeldensis]|uniref:Zn-dependent protease with chaperone function n=1 Tax=Amycolatopsis saalfeldensis TaxID=394193 RepID=A0A1H8YLB7_9PSEU|nr:M48 family metallopeptidase [Amycolatopsis saalfeldensis]SEP52939.1 Zn-dependent protease with chaperone function [Amycolatopsis saalfeldensis]